MLDPFISSIAIRQYGKNIISDFHRSIQPPIQPPILQPEQVPIPLREGGKVAIIGAGIGGLYAAMLLRDKNIPFEILEASDRYGGRLFTHRFSDEEHDYYDVGAMRFPKTPLMDPVFKLFNRLGIWEGGKLIPYIFESPNSTLYYNSVLVQRANHRGNPEDFGISDITGHTWPELVKNVIDPLAKELAKDVTSETDSNAGWKLMMEYDKYSTRAYMAGNRSDARPELDKLGLMPYSLEAVSCCETFDKSTAWYDRGLSETVLEALAFTWPESDPRREIKWFCVDGGSSVISDRMVKHLGIEVGKELKLNSRVTSISIPDKGNQGIEVTLADGNTRRYDHVINTTTLPCLRTMDLTGAKLDYKQKSCLRELRYGPAIKIGIKFKSAWWEDESRMPFGSIIGGQSFADNMSRTVIYPSYGIEKGCKKSTVLIASYAWTDDAIMLSALMGPDDYSKSVLKRRILQDLVAVHGLDKNEGLEFLEDQYVDSFPFSWNNNPYSMGAYGFFGPGEFVNLFQNLTRPAALGRLHFAGEAVSVRHAWVVGALEASQRAVKEILVSSYKLQKDKMDQFEHEWGWLDVESLKWSDENIKKQIAISLEGIFPENAGEGTD